MTINAQRKVFGKTPIKIPPACVADQTDCNLDKRMRLTKLRKIGESPLGLRRDPSKKSHSLNMNNSLHIPAIQQSLNESYQESDS